MALKIPNSRVVLPPVPSEPPPVDKAFKDHLKTKSNESQNYISFVYQIMLAETCFSATMTWFKNPNDHSLCIGHENPPEENKSICKIDLKSRQYWGKKGLKSFDVQGKRVDIFWDFRRAKFSTDPYPCSDYYVALVHKKELLLLLGDLDVEAYERTKSQPSSEKAALLCKKESIYGKKLFCTKAMIEEGKTEEHDIVIETSLSGPDDPEMWISIDGILATRVTNLNWRFRGNEAVMVNNLHVQIFWDVHDWLFKELGSGHGLFIFKPGSLESTDQYSDANGRDCSETREETQSTNEGYCHFLYAWKTE